MSKVNPVLPATEKVSFHRPAWAEVNLSCIRKNLALFKGRLPKSCKIMFVVKANAYGHGSIPLSHLAEKEGVEALGVSSIEEGMAIREAGVSLPVLVLGSLYPFDGFRVAAENDLSVTVASLEAARSVAEVAEKHDLRISVHVKIETGMGRIGVSTPAALGVLKYLFGNRRIRIAGVYTHLASADTDRDYTLSQLSEFSDFVSRAGSAGLSLGLRHVANSCGALNYPESLWDMVRPGLALYGLLPPFSPALSLKSRVVFVKTVSEGKLLGYNGTFRTSRKSRIATLPIGYADGVSRLLSNRGNVLVRGRRCPIAGQISMDMMMVDVTGIPECHVGDEAVLLGVQGGEKITAGEVAGILGTISYEVVCSIASRVPRIYKN